MEILRGSLNWYNQIFVDVLVNALVGKNKGFPRGTHLYVNTKHELCLYTGAYICQVDAQTFTSKFEMPIGEYDFNYSHRGGICNFIPKDNNKEWGVNVDTFANGDIIATDELNVSEAIIQDNNPKLDEYSFMCWQFSQVLQLYKNIPEAVVGKNIFVDYKKVSPLIQERCHYNITYFSQKENILTLFKKSENEKKVLRLLIMPVTLHENLAQTLKECFQQKEN